MTSQINWQAAAVVIAVLLGGGLTAIGYLIRGREERRRILNVSFFHLLEVRNQLLVLSRWKPAMLAEALVDEIKQQLPSLAVPEQERTDAVAALSSICQPLLSELMEKREQSLEHSFIEAIENLSKVDPLIAARLNGNRSIKAAIVSINAYFRRSEMLVAATKPAELPQFQMATQDVQEFIYDDTLRDLEKDLKSLSVQIGIRMWVRTNRYLRKRRGFDMDDLRRDLRPYITRLLPHIQEQAKPKSTASGPKP